MIVSPSRDWRVASRNQKRTCKEKGLVLTAAALFTLSMLGRNHMQAGIAKLGEL
jgi:hypothetical protein